MDKAILKEYSVLMGEASELIVKLAGNLQRAENAIMGTGAEKDYNRGAHYWTATDALDILHRFQTLKADIENELDAVIFAESKERNPK